MSQMSYIIYLLCTQWDERITFAPGPTPNRNIISSTSVQESIKVRRLVCTLQLMHVSRICGMLHKKLKYYCPLDLDRSDVMILNVWRNCQWPLQRKKNIKVLKKGALKRLCQIFTWWFKLLVLCNQY